MIGSDYQAHFYQMDRLHHLLTEIGFGLRSSNNDWQVNKSKTDLSVTLRATPQNNSGVSTRAAAESNYLTLTYA